MCFVRMAEMSNGVFDEDRSAKLKRGVLRMISADRYNWDEYGARPLRFAPDPASMFAQELEEAIQSQLDHEIDQQTSDGSWQPQWSWG
jgi:hypothetical protein